MNYCKYCMSEIEPGSAVCPVCGETLTSEEPMHHLQPGTVLAGKYIVGAALGEGGFGITYLGINTKLDMKVAIKEYFPFGYVHRVATASPVVTSRTENTEGAVFENGREKFLSEARTLAKFNNEIGVVSVHDFFEENNTGYIVMEYLEGETLKAYLQKHARLSYDDALSLLMPAMLSLSKVHEKGLIHRDISPDNIMITGSKVKLLDFGAARYADGAKSLSVMLKHGYAPEEQYRKKGDQGPWTDVYALSATLYKCITGATPDEATERTFKDALKPPSAYGVQIDPKCEAALMKGLAVYADDRYRTVKDLVKGLLGKDDALAAVLPPVSGAEKAAPDGKTESKGKTADKKTVRRGKTQDAEKTVLAEKEKDPDKTVYENDPDKTVYTGKPSPDAAKEPQPQPEYKEKTKLNKKALLIALVSLFVAAVIIGTVVAVSLNRGKDPAPVLPDETPYEDTDAHTHTGTENVTADTVDITEPSAIPVSTEGQSETEAQTDPVTTETPVTDKPGETEHVHTFGGWITVRNPTCTETGEEEHVCTSCGEKETRTTEAKGHTPVTDSAVAATCTETGKTEGVHCSVCGEIITEQASVAALGHDFGSYKQTKAPTCTETGTEERTCSRCGEKETRTLNAKGHTVVIDAATVTCTEAGKTEGSHCSVCGTVIKAQTTVAALGHDYGDSNQCSRCKDITVECFSLRLNYDGTYDIRANRKGNMPAEVVIPSTYNGIPVTSICQPQGGEGTAVGGDGFRDCSGIKSISIPDSIVWINGNAFCGCSGLTKIEVAKDNTVYHSAGNCLIETKKKTIISGCKNSVIPADGSVTGIGDYAFSGCRGLKSITIPDSITSIGGGAFDECSGLTSITIPKSVTSIEVNVSEGMFSGCSGLTKIEVAKDNTVYHSAGNCIIETKSKTLILGCNNSVIPADGSVTSIGNGAFSGCSGLTSITIPDSVTSIGNGAFQGCSGLTSITIPDSVTSIGAFAFGECSGLTSVTIGNGVTSIGFWAFSGCSGLTSVIFKNPNGWKAGGAALSSSDLANPSTAAKYLTRTYEDDDWIRS